MFIAHPYFLLFEFLFIFHNAEAPKGRQEAPPPGDPARPADTSELCMSSEMFSYPGIGSHLLLSLPF